MLKHLFRVFLLAAIPIIAVAEDFDLGGFGKLSLDRPPTWTAAVRRTATGNTAITLEPKEGNARCVILIELMKTPIPIDQEKIKEAVLRACEKPMGGSVEKKKILKPMDLQQGYGVYCAFRDAALVGKPAVKGDFKTYAIGKLQLTETVGGIVSIFADELDGDDAIAMWQMVRSLHVAPAK